VAPDWTKQRLADILGARVDRPTLIEITTLGAAYLAGLLSGFHPTILSTSTEMTPHASNGLPFVSGRNNAATRPRM
jgi:glycerol kinase